MGADGGHGELQRLVGRQWTVVRIDQLRELGWSRRQIARLVIKQVLHPRFKGIYTYGTDRPPAKGLLLAAQWSVGSDAYLTGRTSLGLIKVCGLYLREIEVGVPRRTLRSRERPIRVMRTVSAPDHLRRDGPLVFTTVERALVDLASRGVGAEELKRLITTAIHNKRFSHARMRDELTSFAGHRGARALRLAYGAYIPDPKARSGLERSFDRRLRERPWLPTPEPNHHITAGGVTWELDRYFPDEKVAVELHGGGYHHADTDLEKDSFKAVKLALIGIQTIAITDTRWELEPEQCLDDLEAMLVQRGWRRAA